MANNSTGTKKPGVWTRLPIARSVVSASATYKTLDKKDRTRFWVDGTLNNALYILMAIFIIYTAVVNQNFLKAPSLVNIISQVAYYLPIALGVGGCIVLTGTDLSAGRIMGLSAALSVLVLQTSGSKLLGWIPDMPLWAGILVAVLAVSLVGAFIGAVNGFFVAKFKLHPFIVTLATQLITYGAILVLFNVNGNKGAPLGGYETGYKKFVTGTMIDFGNNIKLPWYVLYAAILVVIMWFIWNKTTFGKNMFAVGSNQEAASVSGVNVFKTIVMVHALAGLMYGLNGFFVPPNVGSVVSSTGVNAECEAIAACVIGGVSFVGGTGKISGIVLGVFILRVIFVALNMLSIDANIQNIIKGAIILFACALDMRKYLVKK